MGSFAPLPLAIGQQSSSAVFDPQLGDLKRDEASGKWYRMCKASAALLVNGAVVTAYAAGLPTFSVAHSILVGESDVVGVVPSVYTSGVTSGNYFWCQVGGPTTFIAGDTVIAKASGAEYRLVLYSVASGQVRAASAFTTASTYAVAFPLAFATNTAVATAIGQTITGVLYGLVDKW